MVWTGWVGISVTYGEVAFLFGIGLLRDPINGEDVLPIEPLGLSQIAFVDRKRLCRVRGGKTRLC